MNEFAQLRARARDKRDKAINEVRLEYEEALTKIAILEQDLLGTNPTKHRTISGCIDRVIPSDREFTIQEILANLEALDPTRVWRKHSVDSHISRLRVKGILRRVKRHIGSQLAVYVRTGVKADDPPTLDLTLLEVMRSVMVKPMTCTEIVLAVIETGYPTSMTRNND